MSNTLLTIDMITRMALRLFINTNAFIRNINKQYDNMFAIDGAKIGDTARIRLPNDYTVRTGAAASVQDTAEQSTTLTLSTQQGVDVSFSSADLTLKLDDFGERVLSPMMNNLTGEVAVNIMSGAEGGASNFISLTSTGAIVSPTAETWLLAGAALDQISAPKGKRKIIMDPLTQARTVNTLSGFFNPQAKISGQYEKGEMSRDTLGFDWMMDQSVRIHTTGTYTAGNVSGADQTGNTLTVAAITGTFKKGDIITLQGVNSVNRVFKEDNGVPAQFAVTADVANGATSIPIYPAITPPVGGSKVQYQTVTASPANGATITVVSAASERYRKNLALVPEAVTMATADLVMPPNVEGSRHNQDGVSMRMVRQFAIGTDQLITRLDVLYGYKYVRPEWVVVVADKI